MWCANCNRTSYSNICEVCGGKTQQDTPIELFWCDSCHIPVIVEASDTGTHYCPICGKQIRYLAKDLRPVFPEERLLLEIIQNKPFAYKNASVWASGSRYYIDGKTSNLSIDLLKKLDANKISIELEEFTIIRSQRFVRTLSSSKVRGEKSNLSVYYKEPNGNSYPIKPYECANTINKILPVGLSDYFFFDGERIQDINNKRDVVSAVRGLMGLDVAKVAVDHLDPSKSNSVIRKLQNDLKVGSDDTSRTLQRKSTQAASDLEAKQARLKKVDEEIEFAQAEKERFAEILRSTAEVRGLQTSRDSLERQLAGTESSVKSAQDRLIMDFNRDYFSFFIQPLLGRAKKVLSASTKQMEKVKQGMDVFNAYARGGIEWLYQEITANNASTTEDFLERVTVMVKEFSEDYLENESAL